jgi:hypothetical protein
MRQLHEVETVANGTRLSKFRKFGPTAITRNEVGPKTITHIEAVPEATTRNEANTDGSNLETINHDDMTSSNSTKLNLDSILHDDLAVHAMRFIFTDSSGRLMSFHSFSRSIRPTDCLFHISHGSCYYICIIFTGCKIIAR